MVPGKLAWFLWHFLRECDFSYLPVYLRAMVAGQSLMNERGANGCRENAENRRWRVKRNGNDWEGDPKSLGCGRNYRRIPWCVLLFFFNKHVSFAATNQSRITWQGPSLVSNTREPDAGYSQCKVRNRWIALGQVVRGTALLRTYIYYTFTFVYDYFFFLFSLSVPFSLRVCAVFVTILMEPSGFLPEA